MLLKNTVIYSASRYIQQVIGFLLIPVYTRVFSPADYGVIDILYVLITTGTILTILGLDSAFARFYMDTRDAAGKRDVVTTILTLRVCAAVAAALMLFLGAPFFSRLFFKGNGIYGPEIRLVAVNLVFTVIYQMALSVLRFEFKARAFAVISILMTLGTLSLTLVLVLYAGWGIRGIFAAQTVMLVCWGIPVTVYVLRANLARRISFALAVRTLRFGLPLVPAGLSYWIITYSDRYFLLHFSDVSAIGLFSLGEKFVRVLVMLVAGFELAWAPFAYAVYQKENGPRLVADVFLVFCACMCTAVAGISLFSPEVIRLMAAESFYPAYRIVPWLAAGPIAYGIYFIVALGANIRKKTGYIGMTSFGAAVVNVILNYLLIPRFGTIGAAAATSAAHIISAVILYCVSQSLYPFPFQAGRAVITCLLLAFVIVTGLTVPMASGVLQLGWKSLVFLSFPAMLILFRIVGIGQIKNVLSAGLFIRRPGHG